MKRSEGLPYDIIDIERPKFHTTGRTTSARVDWAFNFSDCGVLVLEENFFVMSDLRHGSWECPDKRGDIIYRVETQPHAFLRRV